MLNLLPGVERTMFGAVLDVATVRGEASFALEALILGSLKLGEAPLLGDEDLKEKERKKLVMMI